MKRNNIIILVAVVLIMLGIILCTQQWLKSNQEQRAESIAQSQATSISSEPSSIPQMVEDKSTDITSTIQEEQPTSNNDTNEIQNSDGSVTADRDWNKKPDEGTPAGEDANLASGGGEMPLDESGIYHGEPEPTPAPQQPVPEQQPAPGVLPGFENAVDGGPNISEPSNFQGEWDWTQVGNM